MVLWRPPFAMILFLCGLTCAKTDNDSQGISSSSMDPMQKGFLRYYGNIFPCRYSKLMSVLKENFNLDSEASGFDNVKAKKNHGMKRRESLSSKDSSDEDADSTMAQFADDVKENFLSTYDDFDFLKDADAKRGNNSPNIGCDCKIKNDLLDLGHLHYPRYLLNAVCQKDDDTFEYPPKCWRGAQCKPLEYKVRVLTYRSHNDHLQKDPSMSLLPDVLRSFWKFKTVTVAAGCFCS